MKPRYLQRAVAMTVVGYETEPVTRVLTCFPISNKTEVEAALKHELCIPHSSAAK